MNGIRELKRIFLVIIIALVFSLFIVSCNPSYEENHESGNIPSSTGSGYEIRPFGLQAYKPNLVTVFLQVYKDGKPAVDLSLDDFVVKDDGKELAFMESFVNMKKAELLNYSFKTVIAVDVSGSITYEDIEKIKAALREMINAKAPFQEIKILTFAGDVKVLIDFTRDKEKLLEAVDEIEKGPITGTNLYGAVVEGAKSLQDKFGVDEVVMSMMIVMTDGVDTANVYTAEDAYNAVKGKRVYTIGVGEKVDDEVLKRIGSEGYMAIGSFDEIISAFKDIQDYILQYISSFYMIYYLTPKRAGKHSVTVSLGDDSITYDYNADGFTDPHVFVKVTDVSTSDGNIASISLKTVMETELVEEFSFVNPEYEIYSSSPTDVEKCVLSVPDKKFYDEATLMIKFPSSDLYEIEVLDKTYDVKSDKIKIDLR